MYAENACKLKFIDMELIARNIALEKIKAAV
jgi:hypothetical protein